MIQFTVPGEPEGKGRPRARAAGGNRINMYTPARTKAYEALIGYTASQVAPVPPLQGPVRVAVTAYTEPPASWATWKRDMALEGHILPTVKPDPDNIVKAVLDACNHVVWHDDVLVVEQSIVKRYGLEPRLDVTVEPLNAFGAQLKKRP